ncbi:hypothetical protein ABI59_02080 [Acidobacteria bacterium Mor1]|nr:hypothetical protein ABI59_02080 [Acidobacteria bacterium Mor1]
MLMALGAGAALLVNVPESGPGNALGAGASRAPWSEAPVVFLDGLNRSSGQVAANRRDLFGFASRPATPGGGTLQPQPAAPVAPVRPFGGKAAVATPQPARTNVAPVVAGPPVANFRYLGFLGPADRRIGVFEAGGELLLARAGESLQKDFVVKGFGHEEVELGYADAAFAGRSQRLELDHAGARWAGASKTRQSRRR